MKEMNPMVMFFAGLALAIGIVALVLWWLLRRQRSDGLGAAKIKPLWGNGEMLFAEDWVLKLRVSVPRGDTQLMSRNEMEQFYEQLVHYHSAAMAATEYFSDGTYFVKRNGTMCRIVAGGIHQNDYAEISATIDFQDIPSCEEIAERLNAKPETAMERVKNCVSLGVQAHGMGKKKGEVEFVSTPRFAARNGQIIVESY